MVDLETSSSTASTTFAWLLLLFEQWPKNNTGYLLPMGDYIVTQLNRGFYNKPF